MGEHKTGRPSSSTYRRDVAREVRLGITVGIVTAVFFSLYATLAYLVIGGHATAAQAGPSLAAVAAAYLVAGVLVGCVYGVLHPLKRVMWGSALLGAICGVLLYGCIQITQKGLPTVWAPTDWQGVLWLGAVIGAVVGGGYWVYFRRKDA